MMLFSTERTDVYLLATDLAESFQDYLLNNRSHLAPFEPLRNEDYFQPDNIIDRIMNSLNDYENRKCLNLVFTLKNENTIIGSINFTNFVFGVFEACYLGFSLDHAYQGKGLMHEALDKSISYVREQYGMHRIMANHLPGNIRSSKTLGSLGFVKEGYAQSYLKINGVWQDHVLNSLVLP
ncbi:GNAT family N-acetyltransferase [Kosakonia sp. MUSA4]|uniref:GNAT family N-acetyltransferase n=1 Tax=Kosakonia sp. MUSA4 TaxID=2067958 RepID=UPI00159805EB|nr:GNAT family N-acetyltransferase [Kosakonia sp. MUSA4]QJT80540.1 GNAT family N-acetyltransferase [Kosakonia sp. MUSA4]